VPHPAGSYGPPRTPRRRVKGNDQLPPCVDRGFCPARSTPAQRAAASAPAAVAGAARALFQRAPLPPPPPADAAAAHLATQLAAVRFAAAPPAPPPPAPPPPEPPSKEAGTQSEYRESEAQTLPWSPGYVPPAAGSRGGTRLAATGAAGPELLALADLKWGDGLPGARALAG
jgi:hypothetical protein